VRRGFPWIGRWIDILIDRLKDYQEVTSFKSVVHIELQLSQKQLSKMCQNICRMRVNILRLYIQRLLVNDDTIYPVACHQTPPVSPRSRPTLSSQANKETVQNSWSQKPICLAFQAPSNYNNPALFTLSSPLPGYCSSTDG
jgi:hypothetical protein